MICSTLLQMILMQTSKLTKRYQKSWPNSIRDGRRNLTQINSEKLKKHSRPGNLDSLAVPSVNPETWANMSHAVKRVDLRAGNTQTIASKMGTIIAKCTDNLLKACENDAKKINLDEMVGFHTDALALQQQQHY